MTKRDFLKLSDLTLPEHESLFRRAEALKASRQRRERLTTLAGTTLLLIFEKASTRTRLSFEAAISQLGGAAIALAVNDSQLARGEPLSDTARVASRYCDAIVFRTHGDDRLTELASSAAVPVINGLSEGGHPVQLLADLMTIRERWGRLEELTVAWVGDSASNMARSWCEAAGIFGFQLKLAAPEGYRPSDAWLRESKGRATVVETPRAACLGAHVVTTDVWTSMGQEQTMAARRRALQGYQVDDELIATAESKAIFLHCLPAHRGEEVTASVIDGPRSAVWDEAENRLHVQKALLEALILS